MAPFNAESTADEVASNTKAQIAGKTVLVTGASITSLGGTFAVSIAKYSPAGIIIATRDTTKAQETARLITEAAPSVRTWCVELHLDSQKQIRKAVEEINGLGQRIDVIVNNAGVMARDFTLSEDGIESQFATNHIGHFLFTNLLLPKILEDPAPVRVVNVSSNGYRFGPVRFEDWNFDEGKTYNKWLGYSQSKAANMLFSVGLARRLGSRGLVSVSLHPGVILDTGLAKHLTEEQLKEFFELDHIVGNRRYWNGVPFKSPQQGAATHVFAAFDPSLDDAKFNGSYLEDCTVIEHKTYASWARDPTDAERLWELSEKLVGQTFSY